MKISILVFDLSGNCVVRTYPIAKVLERNYKVEIVGAVCGDRIHPPYKDDFTYNAFPFDRSGNRISQTANLFRLCGKLLKKIDGDVIYAFMPLVLSLGVGLLAKYTKKRPLVLDIDEWDMERYYGLSFAQRLSLMAHLNDPYNELYARLFDPLIKLADEIIVVSDFLLRRYGGVKIVHGADCLYFDPAKYDRGSLRRKWGFADDLKLILFAGTPWPPKGLEDILQALRLIKSDSVKLLIMGERNYYFEKLKKMGGDAVIDIAPQPHLTMPEFLALADTVLLPQRKTVLAEAQIPGKVFEAMAMSKPIIATKISDLPEILDGCGLIVEPENNEQLAEAIKYVFDNPEEANEMGRKARERCIDKYSWDAM